MKPRVIDYLKVIEEEQELSEQLIPFDEVIADKAGTGTKGFAMIKGKSIAELYDIIKNNPNTHYKFCGVDYIKNSTKEEFENMMFSAIIRKSRLGTDFATSELIGSRVAEAFGVDCPYVAPMGKNNKIVASLDFLKYSQEMETFAEFTSTMLPRQSYATMWVRGLDRNINEHKSLILLSEKERYRLRKELIKHYIVRKFLLKDNDFNCGNLAVVMAEKEQPQLVSFDFEFCLNNSLSLYSPNSVTRESMKNDIEALIKEYPDELRDVLSELQMTPEKSEQIKSIFAKFLNRGTAEYWTYSIGETIERLNDYQSKFTSEMAM